MRISKGFLKQMSKVNTTFCFEKTEFYIFEKKNTLFGKKNMKIA